MITSISSSINIQNTSYNFDAIFAERQNLISSIENIEITSRELLYTASQIPTTNISNYKNQLTSVRVPVLGSAWEGLRSVYPITTNFVDRVDAFERDVDRFTQNMQTLNSLDEFKQILNAHSDITTIENTREFANNISKHEILLNRVIRETSNFANQINNFANEAERANQALIDATFNPRLQPVRGVIMNLQNNVALFENSVYRARLDINDLMSELNYVQNILSQ